MIPLYLLYEILKSCRKLSNKRFKIQMLPKQVYCLKWHSYFVNHLFPQKRESVEKNGILYWILNLKCNLFQSKIDKSNVQVVKFTFTCKRQTLVIVNYSLSLSPQHFVLKLDLYCAKRDRWIYCFSPNKSSLSQVVLRECSRKSLANIRTQNMRVS
jgi:hypothetical protein